MDSVSDVHVGPLPADSPYMKPFRLHFKQNGMEKNWGEKEVEKKLNRFYVENSNYATL